METLTIVETSKYLNVSIASLALWRNERRHLPYLKAPNGHISYRKADLDAHIEKKGVRGTETVLIQPLK